MAFIEVECEGIHWSEPEGFPALVLRPHIDPERVLIIWVDKESAQEIEYRYNDNQPQRPNAFDLLSNNLCTHLREVAIVSAYEGLFLADLVMQDEKRVDARPSDACILALILKVPIKVDKEVFDNNSVFAGLADKKSLFKNGPAIDDSEVDDFLKKLFTEED